MAVDLAVVGGLASGAAFGAPARRVVAVLAACAVFAVVAVVRGLVVDVEVDGVDVDVDVLDVVVARVNGGSVSDALASWERRMAGSLCRLGKPAMATPMTAQKTSISTVIVR